MKIVSKEQKHKLLTKEVAEIFNTISPDDVLFREKDGNWFLADNKLTSSQLMQYADEADVIKTTLLWNEIVKCMKYLTNRNMYLRGVKDDDFIAGKLVYLTLKNIETILDSASKLKERPPKSLN